MKAIKRTIASLLATLMFVSCFSFNVAFGADTYTEEEAIAVSKVNAASIMTGTENGFEPSKTLTRAEAAAIVVRMKGVPESQVESAKGNTLFTDVPASSWAAGYINAASSMNIISGVGNGLFQPDREVTVIEFVAMATRALGAGKLVDSIGTWPTNYVNFASEEKLLEGVLKVYTAPATRMDVAYMVVNTLEAKMWEKNKVTNTNEVTYEKTNKTILTNVLEIKEFESLTVATVDTKERTVTFEETTTPSIVNYDVVDAVELASLRAGHEVDVWVKVEDEEIIRIAPAEKAKTDSVKFTKIVKIDTDKNEITLLVNGKEKKYDYATTTTGGVETVDLKFSLNTLGATKAVTEVADHAYADDDSDDECDVCGGADDATNCPTVMLANADSDYLTKGNISGTAVLVKNEIVTIYAEQYQQFGVVKEVRKDKIYFEGSKVTGATWTTTIDMDHEDYEYVVTKNGKEIDITDVEEGDALYLYTDGKRYVILVNNYTVEGAVKGVSEKKYANVDGEKYNYTKNLNDTDLDGELESVGISAGDEVKLYLNGDKEVVMYQKLDGAVDSTVAMVKSLREVTKEYVTDSRKFEIVLVQLDGTVLDAKIVNVEKSAEKMATALTLGDGTEVADFEAKLTSDLVGTMVRYTLRSGEVVIREMDAAPTTGATAKLATSFTDEKEVEEFTAFKYNENSAQLYNAGKTVKYVLTEDTLIYVEKAVSGSAGAYSCKFEQVAFEDLGTVTSATLAGYVFGIAESTREIDAVLFTTSVARSTEENYAVVLEVEPYTSDDEDLEDYNVKYTLLLNDGSVEVVLVHDDVDDAIYTDKGSDVAAGDIIEAFIEDDKLVDANIVTTATTATVNVRTINGEVSANVVVAADTTDVIYFAENCLFFAENEDGDLVAGELGEVPTTSSNVAYSNTDKEIMVITYSMENTDKDINEVIAVKYFVE